MVSGLNHVVINKESLKDYEGFLKDDIGTVLDEMVKNRKPLLVSTQLEELDFVSIFNFFNDGDSILYTGFVGPMRFSLTRLDSGWILLKGD